MKHPVKHCLTCRFEPKWRPVAGEKALQGVCGNGLHSRVPSCCVKAVIIWRSHSRACSMTSRVDSGRASSAGSPGASTGSAATISAPSGAGSDPAGDIQAAAANGSAFACGSGSSTSSASAEVWPSGSISAVAAAVS